MGREKVENGEGYGFQMVDCYLQKLVVNSIIFIAEIFFLAVSFSSY